ncbi:MAG: hypothetical protein KGL12_11600 [Rhodospirillales bacterium]|nr:hypothetical protein [Rhodospirillales bacterium]
MLQIIGSGFGRTGTLSLKTALEILGFAPCHHMEEVFRNPAQVAHWTGLAAGQGIDPAAAFAGYRAQVDWPGAHVWRELADAYPQAKVIHSVRPEELWWKSFSATIGKVLTLYPALPAPPHVRAMMEAAHRLIGEETFAGAFTDRAAALAAYRRRTAEVRAAIAPTRLLVYDVAEGWGPLCRFLGVAEPAAEFPHLNTTEAFWQHLGGPPG